MKKQGFKRQGGISSLLSRMVKPQSRTDTVTMYSWTHFFFQGYGNKTKLFVLLCTSGLLVGRSATALSPEFSAGFTNGRVQDCHLVEMIDIETICF